jgi:hypothetical protein
MEDELYQELHTMLPDHVGIDDEYAAWYDHPGFHVLLHGFDEKQKSEYNEAGLAYTAFYIDLKKGLVTHVETEGTD